MEIQIAALCDSAADYGGKLCVIGTFDTIVAQSFPTAVALKSPHILNAKGATYAQSADWGVTEAEGFIKLFGMSSTLWAEVNRAEGNRSALK